MFVNLYWRNYFESHILERGYDYYINGKVATIRSTDRGYLGVVSGTDDYDVGIYFPDHEIEGEGSSEVEMDCSCPYAADGNNCKHMAAILYAIEKQSASTDWATTSTLQGAPNTNEKSKSLEEVVEGLPPETVRKELISVLKSNRNMRTAFLLKYERNEKRVFDYINSIRATADEILDQCADRGYVDWKNASDFADRLTNEVLGALWDFLEADTDELKMAFDLSLYVYRMVAGTSIDDHGELDIIVDECLSLWEDILANADNSTFVKYVFDEMLKTYNRIGSGEYMAECIDDFISDHFCDGVYLSERLDILDARIDRLEKEDGWNTERLLSRCVLERLRLMGEKAVTHSEIEEFQKRYWYLSEVRKVKMDELEINGDLERLIQLLIESKNTDLGKPGLVSKYSMKLIECYRKLNDMKKAKDELFAFVTVYSRGDADAFQDLKQYYGDDDWLCKREEIFSILTKKKTDIKPLLAAEKLTERLFEELSGEMVKSNGMEKSMVSSLTKYESFLRPEYVSELLDFYQSLIRKMAISSGGRGHYKDIANAIRKMLVYPGGKERAREMLDNWRLSYRNRPAMQEELQVIYSEVCR